MVLPVNLPSDSYGLEENFLRLGKLALTLQGYPDVVGCCGDYGPRSTCGLGEFEGTPCGLERSLKIALLIQDHTDCDGDRGDNRVLRFIGSFGDCEGSPSELERFLQIPLLSQNRSYVVGASGDLGMVRPISGHIDFEGSSSVLESSL